MIKYIVTWFLMTPMACPNNKPNEYGQYPQISCTVLHMGREYKTREFTNRDSAFLFCNNAPYGSTVDSISNGIKYHIYDKPSSLPILSPCYTVDMQGNPIKVNNDR